MEFERRNEPLKSLKNLKEGRGGLSPGRGFASGRGALYFRPQRIEKIHPAFDSLLRGVLESDPDGTVVMFRGRHPGAFEQLTIRSRRTLGVRIVTLPGTRNAERYALALYRKLGIPDLIEESEQQYIQVAVQTGTDGDYRQHLRERILERSDLLFEDH